MLSSSMESIFLPLLASDRTVILSRFCRCIAKDLLPISDSSSIDFHFVGDTLSSLLLNISTRRIDSKRKIIKKAFERKKIKSMKILRHSLIIHGKCYVRLTFKGILEGVETTCCRNDAVWKSWRSFYSFT